MTDNTQPLPHEAAIIIIGGGVIGCSLAYHLAELGQKNVLLLERKQLTSGTTWHAAGLVARLRATRNLTALAKYSADLYATLERKTGLATGYRQTGSITLALTNERLEELRRNAAMASIFDVEAEMLSPAECVDQYPLLNIKGVKGGVYVPGDGQADPVNITMALAKGARAKGVRILENTKVTGISRANGHVTGVETEHGLIGAPVVVNCAGMWAREVGQWAGVSIPLHAAEHFYVVTEPLAGLQKNLPTLRVPDEEAYFKEDAGKLLIGAFEKQAKPWGMEGIPESFCFDELPEDMDHFMPVLEKAIARLPLLEKAGIATFFNGPESFTPDDRYLLGETPELRNFYVAAGFNSIGIQSAGGAGKALAEWIVAGHPPFDLWDVDIRRMTSFQSNSTYLYNRTKETLGLLYADHFPYRQTETARGIRHSPLHPRLERLGACFGEVAGWERPNWYLTKEQRTAGESPAYEYSWGRQNWFENAAAEHYAVRNGLAFFDLSSFAKFRVEGPDAEAVLQHICANDIAVAPGRIVYTQWLNDRGGIEADLTVTRLSPTAFLVVTAPGVHQRDWNWLTRHIPEDAHCIATDVTSGEAVIALMGPKARDFLQSLTSTDLSNDAFPFATAKEIELGMGQVRAHRITYVGELGYELYVSADMALHIFDTLWEAGRSWNLTPAGMHVLDSCRLEKGYRHFGHDISDEDHVLEAGLGFAVKTDKPEGRFGNFIGRDAVLQLKERGPRRRLLHFQLREPEPLLFHSEPILCEGTQIGFLTSGNYGHHLGAAVGMGYVPRLQDEKLAALTDKNYQINVAGRIVPAVASVKPLYDPQSIRVRS
ncbi:MAG: FAD-dependent oxidoreductase [Rhodobiaceae bacterium]|nr:FAD-dependent oxidoreductase [Rhodobiaceae bacterium]